MIKFTSTSLNINGFEIDDQGVLVANVETQPVMKANQGTGVVVTSNRAVVGSGTRFTLEGRVGSYIEISGEYRKIISIENDERLDVDAPFSIDYPPNVYNLTNIGSPVEEKALSIDPKYINQENDWSAFVEVVEE